MLAIRYMQRLPTALRFLLVVACAAQPVLSANLWGTGAALLLTPMLAAPVAVAWSRLRPSLDLDWADDQVRLPEMEVEGETVTIRNVRYAQYRSRADFDVAWVERTYSVDAVRSVDYIVEPFGVLYGMAHTFVSFGFDDGRYIAVSVEVRREKPEIFGPVKGLFRQYELMYVIGDERDLIGMRANIRRDAVHVYPTTATREQARALFVSMLGRANKLAREPEFYNTLVNNCATNILDHINELVDEPLPYTLRVAIPGFSARYAFDRGLIATSLGFEEAREVYKINGRSDFPPGVHEDEEGTRWSRQIREVGPGDSRAAAT